jgi:sugar/nucleoside kinase (ribokinase family)
MSNKIQSAESGLRPIAIGTGLLALDVVYTTSREEPIGRWAGGTCGNVLTILSFLGWSTYPVARLADNTPAALLCRDLASWGVQLEYITQERHGSTPVIVQHIRQDGGRGLHHFSFRCPICSSRLPGYRPVPASTIRYRLPSMPTPAVFFFDRASRGAIDMAGAFRRNGALIVFEPSTQRDQGLFKEALSVSHIVKVSHERWADRGELSPGENNWLLIETLGSEGLRFRSRLPSSHSSGWQHVAGFPVVKYRDTAGAGDWCTAGIIARLGTQGAKGLEYIGQEEVRDAFRQGQLLASWNCGFEGARGGMCATQIERLNELALEIAPNPSILRSANRRLRGNSLRGAQRDDVSNTEYRRELCHIM